MMKKKRHRKSEAAAKTAPSILIDRRVDESRCGLEGRETRKKNVRKKSELGGGSQKSSVRRRRRRDAEV